MENPADTPSQPTYLQALKSPTAIALIVANLVPLVGVLFFDWNLFTIIFGGWIILALGAPVLALVLLIVLKIVSDARAHHKEHAALQ